MGAFLTNIRYVAWGSLILGLLFLVYAAASLAQLPPPSSPFWQAALRWTHVLSGIMWIGHLYYFNFTQIPNVPKIPEEARGPAISKVIAPAALFWFRWGAMATLITGLLLAWNQNYLFEALSFGALDEPAFAAPKHIFIGIGMWLAIIMWFNVWFIIWPNQQKALGIGEANAALPADVKAKSARTAMLFSRTNTFLSAPMLVAMTGATTLFG
ncbi:MAG: urate hydroxylase PuuD [Hyphomonadaceae bacterium]|nr:urate hydroxylase PuuD [Hyphomonadaceae bacterium]